MREDDDIFIRTEKAPEDWECPWGDGDSEPFDDNDDYDERFMSELERKKFRETPKHGIYAHAYKKQLDNVKIMTLRDQGKSLREIAVALGCSPSTIRNRLKKLLG